MRAAATGLVTRNTNDSVVNELESGILHASISFPLIDTPNMTTPDPNPTLDDTDALDSLEREAKEFDKVRANPYQFDYPGT